MAYDGRTGARIRARRIALGLRQGELAEAVNISSPYLNLIEHDRRRIGGRLLVALARALQVEPQALAEGADPSLVEALEMIAQHGDGRNAPAHELATRFPGWAALIVEQYRRIDDLDAALRTLSDRVTHDPRLASALHEVLSTVTSIRASSAILNEEQDLSADWQARFLRNIDDDAERLAQCSRGLVDYLEGGGSRSGQQDTARLPQEAFEAWLASGSADLPQEPEVRRMASGWLRQAAADAEAIPLDEADGDPLAVAARSGQPLPAVFRRMAVARAGWGLISCDAAGAFLLRLAPEGFHIPRLGAACAQWPVFQVPYRPMQATAGFLEQAGRSRRRFRYWATGELLPGTGLVSPPVYRAHMLLAPDTARPQGPSETVGSTCRICPIETCNARRETSVMPN